MAERGATTVRVRPVGEADAGRVLDLWNAAARFDPLTAPLLFEKVWSDPDFEPDLALLAEVDGRPAGFAFGLVRAAAGPARGFVKMLAVDPAQRRIGLGSRLLATVESGLRERGARLARVCESAPNYLTPGVDARYSAAPHFLEARGYLRVGEACNMTVDLEHRDFDTREAERALAARGITIRRARADDRPGISDLLAAWWPSWLPEVERALGNAPDLLAAWWPSWLPEVERALGNAPASLYVALKGDEVVAFSAYDANNRGTGWFGPMGTAPAARRRGVGHALLFRCLADMAEQGHALATIPWVDPVDFYRQCAGAAVSRIFHRYEKDLSE